MSTWTILRVAFRLLKVLWPLVAYAIGWALIKLSGLGN